ncbi:flagellar hook capping FlgD N-terminal domain-containing protein [Rhodoferax sp.]|uniref:flagellar hook assembly protein FlgD n=1 Tax=Rhodoferax sp. TaxID=50421 RepID=UPI0025DB727B|nr:flagellar hook capping FlgD N-terminal domain-containing protein [Rhodoferax sp.]
MATAVSNATSLTGTGATTSGIVSAQEQTDRFMKLLVAQLNNQDPMNPMDNAQMTSQIAQINTVSGIQELNATMQSMAAQFTSMQVLQGASMVGHGVLVESNTLSVDGGAAKGAINLASKADKVTVDIKTAGGQLLETINLGALPAGQSNFQWDASKYSGLTSATFKVNATQGGNTVKSTDMAQDTVTAVGTDNGAMSLQLKGRTAVTYSAIKSIL